MGPFTLECLQFTLLGSFPSLGSVVRIAKKADFSYYLANLRNIQGVPKNAPIKQTMAKHDRVVNIPKWSIGPKRVRNGKPRFF